jgi:hypothetical protein
MNNTTNDYGSPDGGIGSSAPVVKAWFPSSPSHQPHHVHDNNDVAAAQPSVILLQPNAVTSIAAKHQRHETPVPHNSNRIYEGHLPGEIERPSLRIDLPNILNSTV